jgi:putative ABC transport system ATP-binding protein
MLSMQDVSFKYRHKRNKSFVHVLENVSAQFEKGKVYSILGPSGSGKTTLLSVLGGLDSPDRGTIFLDGTDIRDIGFESLRQNHVAFVFQSYLLIPYLSRLDNVVIAMGHKMPLGIKKSGKQP